MKTKIITLGLLVMVIGTAAPAQAQKTVTAAEAEGIKKEALAKVEQKYGKDNPTVAHMLSDLGSYYESQRKYTLAEQSYKRSIEIWEKQKPERLMGLSGALNGLARFYHRQGQYIQAEPLYRRELAINTARYKKSKKTLPRDAFDDLAGICLELKRYNDAEQLYKSAGTTRAVNVWPDHPSLVRTMITIARIYHAQERYVEAEPLYKRAMVIVEKYKGPDIASVTSCMRCLASLYQDQQRYAEAEELLKRAMEIDEKQKKVSPYKTI